MPGELQLGEQREQGAQSVGLGRSGRDHILPQAGNRGAVCLGTWGWGRVSHEGLLDW